MIRRQGLPDSIPSPSCLVALLSVAWLTGCANTQLSSSSALDDTSLPPADAYTRLGIAYLEQHSNRRAFQALDHALEIAPNDPEALQAMAIVYQRQGEAALASEYFQQALSVDAGHTQARNNYAAFLYEQGRIEEACQQLEKATSDTEYVHRDRLFANLGKCQFKLGNIAGARQSLARAQAINPRLADSYRILAGLEQAEGHRDKAMAQWQYYLQLTGSSPEALEQISDVADNRTSASMSINGDKSRQTAQGDSE